MNTQDRAEHIVGRIAILDVSEVYDYLRAAVGKHVTFENAVNVVYYLRITEYQPRTEYTKPYCTYSAVNDAHPEWESLRHNAVEYVTHLLEAK